MSKYIAKFQRLFEVEVDTETLESAEQLAKQVLTQFPEGTVKLLSILPEGYVEPPDEPEKPTTPKPWGPPAPGGGTPGTPVVKTVALVDQIAEKAA